MTANYSASTCPRHLYLAAMSPPSPTVLTLAPGDRSDLSLYGTTGTSGYWNVRYTYITAVTVMTRGPTLTVPWCVLRRLSIYYFVVHGMDLLSSPSSGPVHSLPMSTSLRTTLFTLETILLIFLNIFRATYAVLTKDTHYALYIYISYTVMVSSISFMRNTPHTHVCL